MTITAHTRCIEFIIKTLLILTPFININEIRWAIGLEEERGGLFLIKYIKDTGFLLIIILSICGVVLKQYIPKSYMVLPLLVIPVGICLLMSINTEGIILLAGLRWCLPLFLCIFLYDNIRPCLLRQLSIIVFWILCINVVFQVAELWLMPPYNGSTYFGLAARVPGIFSHPHSCASFVCLSYVFVNRFLPHKTMVVIANILIVFSLIMAMSSTGVICFLAILSLGKVRKYPALILLLPFVVLFAYNFADILTNRGEGASETSITTRQGFFMDIFYSTELFSNTFGQATNVASMLGKEVIPADAFYPGFLSNLGHIPFFILIIFMLSIGIAALLKNNTLMLQTLILYGLFAFSTVVTEVFPMNLFLPILVAYSTKYKNDSNSSATYSSLS
jgi:hypothetical protein